MRRVGWMSLVMGLGLALSGCTVEDEWAYRGGDDKYDKDHDDKDHDDKDHDDKDHDDKDHDDKDHAHGCTLTMGYWKNHHSDARNPNQQIPWPASMPEDTEICEQTALSWLHTRPVGGDAFVILVRQWIVAQLNEAAGATVPDHIADAMDAAADLLDDCEITAAERNEAIALAELLDAYNNGLEGVPHCDDVND